MSTLILAKTISLGLSCVAGTCILGIATVLVVRKLIPISSELSRKLLHLSAVIALTVWLYIFDDWRITELTAAFLTAVAQPALSLLERLPAASSPSKIAYERNAGELHRSLGAAGVMFMLVTAVCWGWLGNRSLALASIYAWGPGDAAAALVGKRYGKIRLGKARNKSLEGTLAMLATSFVSVLVILSWDGTFSLGEALLVSVATAAITTVVELTTSNGLDTLSCPVAAMTVLCPMCLLLQ